MDSGHENAPSTTGDAPAATGDMPDTTGDMPDTTDDMPDTTDDMALARAALAAVRAVPGVAGISRGRYAIARTFGLGGEAIEGVQLTHADDGLCVEAHVVVRLVPIPPLADAIRAAVVTALRGAGAGEAIAAVDVWVDGLRVDGDDADDADDEPDARKEGTG